MVALPYYLSCGYSETVRVNNLVPFSKYDFYLGTYVYFFAHDEETLLK